MSAKLIYSLSDENKDLQKQIGCMNGIFHLFDRQHFLSARRLKNDATKRLPSGQSSNRGFETNNAFKSATEKHRNSTESSRTSVSSSSWSSSFSSLDCNKTTQLDQSVFSQANYPETPRNMVMKQPNPSHSGRNSPGIQDIVKDTINKGPQGLSVKTATKEKVVNHKIKRVDSPRPALLPNSPKPKNDSPRVLANLKETPWRSVENKNGSIPLRDAPRFSYDGRELRDSFKSVTKLKELPRLSLDSRQGTISSKLGYQQEPESSRGSSSVVAKLMGLEDLPTATPRNEFQTGPYRACQKEQNSQLSNLSKRADEKGQARPLRTSKEVISPKFQSADLVPKSGRSSKILTESAPWRQLDGSKVALTSRLKNQEAPTNSSNSFPSVYGEIEKRLEELEFRKSGRDLRALKQILEAMQKTKERLESRKEDHSSDSTSQTSNKCSFNQCFDLASPRSLQGNSTFSATAKGTSSPKSFKSPIVIMKPVELAEKGSSASLQSSANSPSRLNKTWNGESFSTRKDLSNKQTPKGINPRKSYHRDSSSLTTSARDKKINPKTKMQPKVAQQLADDGFTSSSRSSGSVSPRLRQKKLGLEKHSHPTTVSPDSSTLRSITQSSRQPIETGSPRRKLKPKSLSLQQDSVQGNKIVSNTSDQKCQGSMISHPLTTTSTSASHLGREAICTDGSRNIKCNFFMQAGQVQRNPLAMSNEDKSVDGPITVPLEQPSPVSVLEAAFYKEDPPSPIKKILNAFEDDHCPDADESEWKTTNINLSYHSTKQNLEQANSNCEKHIALREDLNPTHSYIKDIMLCSGLLETDGVPPIKFHSSGHIIEPKLFFLLEESTGSTWSSVDKHRSEEKIQRRLIFDAVNEILVCKLRVEGSLKHRYSTCKLSGRKLRAEQLLRDICTEIDQLQQNKSFCIDEDEEEDYFFSFLEQDLKNEPLCWSDCQQEISGIALDVERLIFKDLINEVVSGDVGSLQSRAGRLCRQLF